MEITHRDANAGRAAMGTALREDYWGGRSGVSGRIPAKEGAATGSATMARCAVTKHAVEQEIAALVQQVAQAEQV
jgi:hypothetical protein